MAIEEGVKLDDEFLSKRNWKILYGLYAISATVKLCKNIVYRHLFCHGDETKNNVFILL